MKEFLEREGEIIYFWRRGILGIEFRVLGLLGRHSTT
jgi:hypothetical protein